MRQFFSKIGYSGVSIFFILIFIIGVHFNLKKWNAPEKLIDWDIKSYYAYFPALVIEKDAKLDFLNDKDYEYRSYIWSIRDDNGNRLILTSMGLAIMYSPFSLIAHYLAPTLGYDQSGFSKPYMVALVFSNLFYLIIGLICLRKILLLYFNDLIATLGVLGVLFGTNLYYYATTSPLMSHAYNFSLIVIFLYLVIKWYKKPRLWLTISVGVIAGLITLIRPSNIFVLILLMFWGISSFNDLKERIIFFIKKWWMVLLMAFFFILVWVPQFLYWHEITGNYFYYSYGVSGGEFYFGNPQFLNQLFSYRSGVLLYSPFLIFSFVGLFFLYRKKNGLFIPVILYLTFTYYLLASWWSWWNGGSFGIRSYIDTYGVLIFGFAALTEYVLTLKRYPKIIFISVTIFLIGYGSFMSYQLHRNVLHYDSNSSKVYWGTMFSLKRIDNYWEETKHHKPDYFLARCGISAYRYREYPEESMRSCMINEIRKIEKDEVIHKSYLLKAKENKVPLYRFIRKDIEKKCKAKYGDSEE